MSDDVAISHLLRGELQAYLDGELMEARETQIEEHLAECDDCTALTREVNAPHPMFERWTARAHGEAYFRAALETALHDTAEHDPALRERVTQWRERWAGMAEAAAHLVLDAPRAASRLVVEQLASLARPGGTLQLAPVAAVGTRGAIRARGSLRTRGAVTKHGPPAVRAGSVGARAEAAVMDIGRDGDTLIVRLHGLPARRQPPLVVLVSVEDPTEHWAQESLRQPKGPHIARFDGIGAGDFLVIVEPVASGR